jgi:hypothetical protein
MRSEKSFCAAGTKSDGQVLFNLASVSISNQSLCLITRLDVSSRIVQATSQEKKIIFYRYTMFLIILFLRFLIVASADLSGMSDLIN